MFSEGDLVQAKKEFLAPYEKLEDTLGLVVDYNPDSDYLKVLSTKQNQPLPSVFNTRGCYYEIVTKAEDLEKENNHD